MVMKEVLGCNKKAIISFVLAVVAVLSYGLAIFLAGSEGGGLFGYWIFFVFVSDFALVVGLVLGILALIEIKHNAQKGKIFAFVPIVFGGLFFVFKLIIFIMGIVRNYF